MTPEDYLRPDGSRAASISELKGLCTVSKAKKVAESGRKVWKSWNATPWIVED